MRQSSNSARLEQAVNANPEEITQNTQDRNSLEVRTSKGKSRLEESLTSLVQLIANITESYSASIFVADPKNRILHSLAFQSLSRDYIANVQIPFGAGLVGWTAENKVRIAVCPFEHDSRTLLYYKNDQSLKSFIAVPITGKNDELVGVIACDSKKSYAFPKITEKLLQDCAVQANLLINLHLSNEELNRNKDLPVQEKKIETFVASLSEANSEEELFTLIEQLPEEFLNRDALLSLLLAHEGYGDPRFYCEANDRRMEQHLLDVTCKQKRISFKEKSLLVLPAEDIRARTYLSVPIFAFEREVGCLNVLSKPFKAFSPKDIEVLELLGKTASRELERIRARTLSNTRQIGPCMLPWDSFLKKANIFLDHNKNQELGFLRLGFHDLICLEGLLGVQTISNAHEQLLRFVQQLSTHPLFVSAPYGSSMFVFGDVRLLEALHKRVVSILSKIDSSSLVLPGMSFDRGTGEILVAYLIANIITLKKGNSYSHNDLDQIITSELNLTLNAKPQIQGEQKTTQKAFKQKFVPAVAPVQVEQPVETLEVISPIVEVPLDTPPVEPKREMAFRVRENRPSTEDLIRGIVRKKDDTDSFTLGNLNLNPKERSNAKSW